ncbi:hypothetical protein BSKO_10189 [Bryopsis sp. KO-2023]|nr:hypothetical protein BSKO_10189 [Bryopsis sp. KO-2023]
MNSPRPASPFGTKPPTPRSKARLSPRQFDSMMDCDTSPSRSRGGFQGFVTNGPRSPRPTTRTPHLEGLRMNRGADTRMLSPRGVEIEGLVDEMVDNVFTGGSVKDSHATEGYSRHGCSRSMDKSVATPRSSFMNSARVDEEEVDSTSRRTGRRSSARGVARLSIYDEEQASAGGLNVRSSTETCESTTPRKNVSTVTPSMGKAREQINFFEIMGDVTPRTAVTTTTVPPTELADRQHKATPFPSSERKGWGSGEEHVGKWCRENKILEDVNECLTPPKPRRKSTSRSPGSVPSTVVVERNGTERGTSGRPSLSNNESLNTFHTPQAEWSVECPSTVLQGNPSNKDAEVTSALRTEWVAPSAAELTFQQDVKERCNQENWSPSAAAPCPLSALQNQYASQDAGLTDDCSSCSDAGFGDVNKENSILLAPSPIQANSPEKVSNTFGDWNATPKEATARPPEVATNGCGSMGFLEDVCMGDVEVGLDEEGGTPPALEISGVGGETSCQLDSQGGRLEGGSQGGAYEFPTLCEVNEEPETRPRVEKTSAGKCLTRAEICRLSVSEFTTDMVATMEEDIAKVVTQLQPGSGKPGRDSRSAKRKKGPNASPRGQPVDASDVVPRRLYEKEQRESAKLRETVRKVKEENCKMSQKMLMLQEQLKILDHKVSLYYTENQDKEIEGWSDWLTAKCQAESSQQALRQERDLRGCIEREVEQGRQALSKMEIDASEMKEKLLGSLLEQEELRKKYREADKKAEESEKEILKLKTAVVQRQVRIQQCEEVEKEKKVVVVPRSKIPSAHTQRFGRGNSGNNGGAYKRFRM